MKSVGELFPELLRKGPQKELPLDEMVRAAWVALVGRQIAERSHVFRLYRECLIVHVPDRAWKEQLRRLEYKLLGRINALFGSSRVTSIDFRVDPQLGKIADPPRKAPARETAIDRDVERSAESIADPELRDLFLRASRKMMK